MPLVVTTLQTQIKNAFITAFNAKNSNPEASIELLSTQLAIAIDAYIKTAQVNPGQLVVGTGGGVPGPVAAATTTPGTLS